MLMTVCLGWWDASEAASAGAGGDCAEPLENGPIFISKTQPELSMLHTAYTTKPIDIRRQDRDRAAFRRATVRTEEVMEDLRARTFGHAPVPPCFHVCPIP